MGAAKYVGRVGGLAVALGVGMAVVTGHGVASADTPSSGSSQTASAGKDGAKDSTRTHRSRKRNQKSEDTQKSVTTDPASDPATADTPDDQEPSTRYDKPRFGAIVESWRADLGGRLGSADDLGASTGDEPASNRPRRRATQNPGGLPGPAPRTQSSDRAAEPGSAPVSDAAGRLPMVSANESAPNAQERAAEWLSSPRVKAGRVATGVTEVSAPTSTLWTPKSRVADPLQRLVVPASSTTVSTSNLLANLVSEAFNPFAGNTPQDAPVDTPAAWLLMAAARREVGIDAATTSLLASPELPYTVSFGIEQGIITGDNTATPGTGNPVIYTVVGEPSLGGRVTLDPETGDFRYLPYADVVTEGSETFDVMVSEVTPLVAALQEIPLVGGLVGSTVMELHQIPILGDALAPIIGYANVVTVTADPSAINGAGVPIAYTYKVESFDGTLIRTNFFPATGAVTGMDYPTVLNGPGLALPGVTDPDDAMLARMRSEGYNVVTWDPRGEFDSGGVLQLNNPQFEGRDVLALIDWTAEQNGVQLDGPGDPRMGMVGGSYGGGIQLAVASIDEQKRVDAIAPMIAWNLLNDSLYPSEAFKTAYSALLLLGLVTSGADINPEVYGGLLTGGLLGFLTEAQQDLLRASGTGESAADITAPTLLIQGTVDVLFPLQQAVANAHYIAGNGQDVPVKMVWFCGGHGSCEQANQGDPGQFVLDQTADWMNTYVKGKDELPGQPETKFTWVDQNGDYYSSDQLPTLPGDDPDYYDGAIETGWSVGQLLPVIPLLGGSGDLSGIPFSLGNGSVATNAVSIDLANPSTGTAYVAGSPKLTMTYSGLGTSRHVYAQVVDKNTGDVVGNLVTPIPVTLDGREHTVDVQLADIAYTMDPGEQADLELQIFTTAIPFLNLTQFGYINVSDVEVLVPVVDGDHVQPGQEWVPARELVSA